MNQQINTHQFNNKNLNIHECNHTCGVCELKKILFFHKKIRNSFFPILINWLFEVNLEVHSLDKKSILNNLNFSYSMLKPFEVTIKLFQEYMLKTEKKITKANLQLVGVSCYSIALQEIYPDKKTYQLSEEECSDYTNNSYSPKNVCDTILHIKETVKKIFFPSITNSINILLQKERKTINDSDYDLLKIFTYYFFSLSLNDLSLLKIDTKYLSERIINSAKYINNKESILISNEKIDNILDNRIIKLYYNTLVSNRNRNYLVLNSMIVKYYLYFMDKYVSQSKGSSKKIKKILFL
jgi:hypothetical protein